MSDTAWTDAPRVKQYEITSQGPTWMLGVLSSDAPGNLVEESLVIWSGGQQITIDGYKNMIEFQKQIDAIIGAYHQHLRHLHGAL